jgi:rod shape-determining protein MreB and related proteins
MGLFSFLTREIAIDLGTANTVIIYNDKVVVDEPSIVAIERSTNRIIAVGKKAQMMHGKTHDNIRTIRPLRDGVIADFQSAEHMLREMIKMINHKKTLFPPALKMVICIPSGITEVERTGGERFCRAGGGKRSKAYSRTYGRCNWDRN